MAGRGKGKEVALQTEVDSQEDWEEVIGKEGLTGISVSDEGALIGYQCQKSDAHRFDLSVYRHIFNSFNYLRPNRNECFS